MRTRLSDGDFDLQPAFEMVGDELGFDVGDEELRMAINGLQQMVECLTGHAAYKIRVRTKDGERHQAPVKRPAVDEAGRITFAGNDDQFQTTAAEFPPSVHVSEINEVQIRMH